MSTLEKQFVQIFERKDWIIEHLQRQADAYTEQLASRLLIDGITPPPSLLNPRFNPRSSDPHELKKEEIISKLLLQRPRVPVRYSTGGHSLYDRPVVSRGDVQLPNEVSMETHAPNKDLNVTNEPPVTLACVNNDIVRTLNRVKEQDDSVNSPQNETDARISSIYAASDTSLARIQRSKSRQKARELRNSAKTAGKSCLGDENRTRISFTGDTISNCDFHPVTQDKCPSEPGKCNDISGTVSVASKTSDKEEIDGGILAQSTDQQSGHVDGVMEVVNLLDTSLGSYGVKKSETCKTHDTQRQSKPYSGRITRSKGSSQQTSGINKSLELGTSSFCNPKEDRGALSYSVDASNKLLDAVETFQVHSDRIGETQAICSSKDVNKPVISSNIAASRVTRSKSGSMKECTIGENHKEDGEIVVESGPIDVPVGVQPVSSGKELDHVTMCTESHGLSLKQSSECCMLVKPKQLNFDEMDGCDSNKVSSLVSRKRKLDGLLEQECNPSIDSASLIDHKSSGTFFEQQLSMENVESNKSKYARAHSHEDFDKCTYVETMNIDLDNGLLSEKRKLDGLLGQECNPSIDSASIDHKSSGTLFEQQLPVEKVESNKSKSARTHSHEDLDKCTNVETMNIDLDNGLLFEKRKLDGLLGQECNPSMDSALAVDHKSSGTFFKQQLSMENVVVSSQSKAARTHSHDDFDECEQDEMMNTQMNSALSVDHKSSGTFFVQQSSMENVVVSSQSKAARTHSHDDFDECAKDEMMSTALDMDENPMVEDNEHNSRDSLHDDVAVLCEGDLHDKGEENTADVFIPVSKDPNSSFTSGSTNQGDKDSEDCLDLGSLKATKLEIGTNSKLSNLKLNSTKVIMWPRDPQRNVEDQRNCFSNTRGVRVLVQGDAIPCDLEASENDLHISQSDDIIQRVHDEMVCQLPERKESLRELQARVAAVTEVDDDTPEHSAPSLIKSAADDSTYDMSADVVAADSNGVDKVMPVFEGFTIDKELENAEGGGIYFETLELPSSTIERASLLEQICKSSSMNTPFSQFSSTFKQHQVQDLYKFMPDGILDEDLRKHISESDCDIAEADYSFPKQQTFDSLPFSGTPFNWQSKNYYSSPVGKLWDRSASSSGSSENRLSSNRELTCFPIEEDPNSSEESENDELQENITLEAANEQKIPSTVATEMEIVTTENDDEVAVAIEEGFIPKVANHEPPSGPMKYRDRCSSNSVNIEVYIPRTHDKVKYKSKFHPGVSRTPSVSTRASIRRTASLQTQNSVRRNVLLQTQNSKNIRSGIKMRSQKEAKRNNIVSNITSFVSIVQQKQAAAVCPGKRDIKVKALEAAEAAKRREQEKENERKMKKEALKIERVRVEKEHAREMELNKKKKQEEMKKKEADVAARKKLREEDERKQMAKKRKIAEARKEQKVQHEKSRGGKNVAIAGNKKGSETVRQNKNSDENGSQRNDKSLADAVQQVTSVPEKETSILEKSPGQVGSVTLTGQEPSYDISPYRCSDDEDEDEDEDEDDLATKKFEPSWASKRAVAMVLPLQHELDPETIFPAGSFCSMDEVLLPRRLQAL